MIDVDMDGLKACEPVCTFSDSNITATFPDVDDFEIFSTGDEYVCKDKELPTAWSEGGMYGCQHYLDHGGTGPHTFCAHQEINDSCCYCGGGDSVNSVMSFLEENGAESGSTAIIISQANLYPDRVVVDLDAVTVVDYFETIVDPPNAK